MSIFGKIKDAIFGEHGPDPLGRANHAPAQAAPKPQATPQAHPTAAPAPAAAAQPTPAQSTPAQPTPAKVVDPIAALEKIAASKGNPDLNWRTSIVDLMKLIGMDSSLANRQQLATELGYQGDKNGSAEMNLWLHDKVMDKIRNG